MRSEFIKKGPTFSYEPNLERLVVRSDSAQKKLPEAGLQRCPKAYKALIRSIKNENFKEFLRVPCADYITSPARVWESPGSSLIRI